MPPKIKVTRHSIIETALDIVREGGDAALNARTIATRLDCSTQPIFYNFATMEQLRFAVLEAADAIYQRSISDEIRRGLYPPYKASGMAYIRFASEEPQLFRLLYMRDRADESVDQDTQLTDAMTDMVMQYTGISQAQADLFHLEMWAFVHGIAVMAATGFLALEPQLYSQMLTDIYQGLKNRFRAKEENP